MGWSSAGGRTRQWPFSVMKAGLHEKFSRDYAVEAASNKRFGLVVGAILLVFGAIRSYLHGEIGWFAGTLGAVGLVLVLAALVKPDLLEPANRGWNRLGVVLHKVTNPLFGPSRCRLMDRPLLRGVMTTQ